METRDSMEYKELMVLQEIKEQLGVQEFKV